MATNIATAASHSSLADLPVELRMHIFSFILSHNAILQRPSTRAAEAQDLSTSPPVETFTPSDVDGRTPSPCVSPSLHLIQTSLLHLNRRLSIEAREVFYAHNRFRISYNHLCTCQARFPYTFDATRIRELELVHVYPRDHGSQTCTICQSAGTGLIPFLQTLPRLRTAVVIFDDMASFGDFAHAFPGPLSSRAVGSLTLATGDGPQSIHVLLPPLQQAWQTGGGQRSISDGWCEQTDFEPSKAAISLLGLMKHLQWEASEHQLTAPQLRPFFVPSNGGFSVLRVPVGERMAAFSLALAQTLADMFLVAELMEEGLWEEGMLDPRWVPVDDRVGGPMNRWSFVQDVDGRDGAGSVATTFVSNDASS
nr:hypothetical protein CFP56_01329 [Quercus suber]